MGYIAQRASPKGAAQLAGMLFRVRVPRGQFECDTLGRLTPTVLACTCACAYVCMHVRARMHVPVCLCMRECAHVSAYVRLCNG